MNKRRTTTLSPEIQAMLDEDGKQTPPNQGSTPRVKPQSSDFLKTSKHAYQTLAENGVLPATTFTDINGNKKTLTPELVEVSFDELEEKTQVSDLNPRLWIEEEYTQLPLVGQIEKEGIRSLATGYKLKGSDLILISNGGTRRAIGIYLNKSKQVEGKYPLLCYELTEDELWIARQLVDDSEYGRKFNSVENALRLGAAFNALSEPKIKTLSEYFEKTTGLTYNGGITKTMLCFAFIKEIIAPYFMVHFSSSEDITVKVMSYAIEFVTGQKVSDLDLTDTNSKNQNTSDRQAKYIIRADAKEFVQHLVNEEQLSKIDTMLAGANKHRPTITKVLKDALASKEETPKEPQRPENGLTLDEPHQAGFTLLFSREDYDSTSMEHVRYVLSRYKDELSALKDKIEKEIKEGIK